MKRPSVAFGVIVAVAAAACGARTATQAPALPTSETAPVRHAPDAADDPNTAVDIGDAKQCYADPAQPARYACFGGDGLALAGARAAVFACAEQTKVMPPVTLIATRAASPAGTWGELDMRGDEAMVACLSAAATAPPLSEAPTAAAAPGTTLTTVIRLRTKD